MDKNMSIQVEPAKGHSETGETEDIY